MRFSRISRKYINKGEINFMVYQNFNQPQQAGQKMTRFQLGVHDREQIVVKGVTTFTRNALEKFDGPELEKYNQQRKLRSPKALAQKPAYKITLTNVEFMQPNAPLSQYYMQHIYPDQQGDMVLTLDNLGNKPRVYEIEEGTNNIVEVNGANYIPSGIEVQLIVEAYVPKDFPQNVSSAFIGIICPPHTEYVNNYVNSTLNADTLSALGFNIVGGSIDVAQPEAPQMPSVQQATGTTGAFNPNPQPAFESEANQVVTQQPFTTPQPTGFNPNPGASPFVQQPTQPVQQQQPSPFGGNVFDQPAGQAPMPNMPNPFMNN